MKITNIFRKKQKQQRIRKEEEVCICGHTKSEHIKFYEEDLEKGEIYGEPHKCLVKGCFCTRFQKC